MLCRHQPSCSLHVNDGVHAVNAAADHAPGEQHQACKTGSMARRSPFAARWRMVQQGCCRRSIEQPQKMSGYTTITWPCHGCLADVTTEKADVRAPRVEQQVLVRMRSTSVPSGGMLSWGDVMSLTRHALMPHASCSHASHLYWQWRAMFHRLWHLTLQRAACWCDRLPLVVRTGGWAWAVDPHRAVLLCRPGRLTGGAAGASIAGLQLLQQLACQVHAFEGIACGGQGGPCA
jgi:hypothetical protein